MLVRTITVILLMAFFAVGCASKKFELQSPQRREYRLEQIKNRHPEWDELTVERWRRGTWKSG